MKDFIIVSDFDGTITEKDSLYHFMEEYALPEWLDVEQDWIDGKIGSKECLIKEFELIPNLCEELIYEFIKTIKIDTYFKDFNEYRKSMDYDFIIVSDGLDYFINKILDINNIDNVRVISNHAEFINNKFVITFPNECSGCIKDSGTCKCNILNKLRNTYNSICYIGDGVSDFCAANKADVLFAKKSLKKYCIENSINHITYDNYGDIKAKLSEALKVSACI